MATKAQEIWNMTRLWSEDPRAKAGATQAAAIIAEVAQLRGLAEFAADTRKAFGLPAPAPRRKARRA